MTLLTGMPAGKNRSRERTGIMKQSCSRVDREIGSLRELTKAPVPGLWGCPLKLTVIKENTWKINVIRAIIGRKCKRPMFFHVPANVQLSCSASAADMHHLKIDSLNDIIPLILFLLSRRALKIGNIDLPPLFSMKYSNTLTNQSESSQNSFFVLVGTIACAFLWSFFLLLIFLRAFFMAIQYDIYGCEEISHTWIVNVRNER